MKNTSIFRRVTLSGLLALGTTAGFAQSPITLTATTHTPAANATYYYHSAYDSVLVSAGGSGTNQTWNFSTLPSDYIDTNTYFSCNAQTNCTSFGNANLVSGSLVDSDLYYFRINTTSFQDKGFENPVISMYYTDSRDLLRFPLTYNTTYVDSFSGSGMLNAGPVPFPVTMTGYDSVKADGWGTLITPMGTYPNTLRIRKSGIETIGIAGQSFEASVQHYEWYHASSRIPLLQISHNTVVDPSSGDVEYSSETQYLQTAPVSVENTSALATTFSISPNPSTGTVQVRTPDAFASEKAEIIISDIAGRVVFTQSFEGAKAATFKTDGWAKGIYLVRIQNAAGQIMMNRLSVQ